MIRSAASKVMWVGRVTVFLGGLAAILALFFGVVLARPAQAETFTVNNTGNSGAGSLPEEIARANTTPGADTVEFVPGLSGEIKLTSGQLQITDDLAINGPGAKALTVTRDTTCSFFCPASFRIFRVAPNITAEISGLTITGGRVVGAGGTSGSTGTSGATGGAGGPGGEAGGGGVLNEGTLTLRAVTVRGNSAEGGSGSNGGGGGASGTTSLPGGRGGDGGAGGEAKGGGILNKGRLTLADSTVNSNTARGGHGGSGGNGGAGASGCTFCGPGGPGGNGGNGNRAGEGRGGGVFNEGISLTVINSTLDSNAAQGGNGGRGGNGGNGGSGTSQGRGGNGGNGGQGGNGLGGGTYRLVGTAAGLTNATVSFNNAFAGAGGGGGSPGSGSCCASFGGSGFGGSALGGGIHGGGSLGNTIVARNTALGGPDVFGTFTSQGNNLIGNMSGGSGFVTSDKTVPDPQLGPLADNGGQTMTRALLPGSPAIDVANAALASAPTKDQRGVVRPQGAAADIGAFEVDATPTVTKATPLASRVSPKANVVATFSEPMDANTLRNPDTLKSTTFVLKKGATTVSAKVTLDSTGKTAILNPTKSLKAGARYTATVGTEAKDLWGTALDQDPATAGNEPKTWSFKVRK